MRSVFSSLRLAGAVGLGAAALGAAAAPAHVAITAPAAAATGEFATRLAAWRQSGAIVSAQLLGVVPGARSAETVPPNAALGALALVEFADEAALARWEQSPAAKLAAGFSVARVDLLAQLAVTPRDSAHAVYLLAEYEIMVPPPRYQEYVDGYVMPQMRAWKTSGLITGAFMYAARDRAKAPFHAVLVLEHRDAAAFARRDAVKDESRKELAADPKWKALSDVTATMRTEKFLSRATRVELPAKVAP